MRERGRGRLAWAGLVLCLLIAICPSPAAGRERPLRVRSPHILDQQGRIVILHGVNVVYKRAPYHPNSSPEAPFAKSFNLRDLRLLRRWGFNTIRYGITWKGIEPRRGRFDRRYIRVVARQIRMAARAGFYVLVDMHQDVYAEEFGGNGAPPWAVKDDGLRSTYPSPPPPFPFGYAHPAVGRSETHFWENEGGIRSEYARSLVRVARRLKGNPRVLGYDTYNEPLCEVAAPACDYKGAASPNGPRPESVDKWLRPFQDQVVRALKRADPSHIVFYEDWVTANFGFPMYMGRAPNRPWRYANTGLSHHVYCGFPVFRDDPCDVEEPDAFKQARLTVKRNRVAPLLTEFGATNDNAVNERLVELADRFGEGWQYWSYKTYDDPTTQAATLEGDPAAQAIVEDNGKVKQDKLRVLARVYPARIAGRDPKWSFDPETSKFELTYTPRGRAPTVILVPTAVHYRHGYRVAVAGAEVLSPPDARHLVLRAHPGARRVRASVAPS